MRTAQVGDRVQVRWTKLFQDGSLVSSRGHAPTELTIGVDHPRLPGLGLALVGLLVGESTRLIVSAQQGYGPFDPGRIHRLSRTWFSDHEDLPLGQWVRVWDRRHCPHLVRIVAVHDRMVVVATNHRWAGQALELEVQLLAILEPDTGSGVEGLLTC